MIAPDKFAGTLTAVEAVGAVTDGWRAVDPTTDPDPVPLSDGGPGFVEVLHAAVRADGGARLRETTVTGPLGDPVTAGTLHRSDAGVDTAYLESAQACGLHLVPPERRVPGAATTFGVGELIAAAVDDGARRIVVGLGGSATTDGGAGLLAALGAHADDPRALARGGDALAGLAHVDIEPVRRRLAGVTLIAATDVDNPLCGLNGASSVFGPQKGADREQVMSLDESLARFAGLAAPWAADLPGAGAAGGLGFALLALGAERESGIGTVLDTVGLDTRVAGADLVITGEGAFDHQSLRGKVPHGVAQAALRHGVPCVVLAGRVEAGRREMAAAGITEAYALVDSPGSPQAAFADPYGELSRLAARVARRWTRAR